MKIQLVCDHCRNILDNFLESIEIVDESDPYYLHTFRIDTYLSNKSCDSGKSARIPVIRSYSYLDDCNNSELSSLIWLEPIYCIGSTTVRLNSPVSPHNRLAEFSLPPIKNLGELNILKVGHDGFGDSPDWFLDKVIVKDPTNGRNFEFVFNCWIELYSKSVGVTVDDDDNECDSSTSLTTSWDAMSTMPIDVKLYTSNLPEGRTTARLYLRVSGPNQKMPEVGLVEGGEPIFNDQSVNSTTSPWVWLPSDIEPMMTSQTGQKHSSPVPDYHNQVEIDEFSVELTSTCLSPFNSLVVGHDNTGSSPDWFLQKAVIYCALTGIEQTFLCNDWITADTGFVERVLKEDRACRLMLATKHAWLVTFHFNQPIKCTDVFHNVNLTLTLYGECAKSDEVCLDQTAVATNVIGQSSSSVSDTLHFKVYLARDIGRPYKLRLRFAASTIDNTGDDFPIELPVKRVTMQLLDTGQVYSFSCNQRLTWSREEATRCYELPEETSAESRGLNKVCQYLVSIATGLSDSEVAGTRANIFLELIGQRGDSGLRQLTNSNRRSTVNELAGQRPFANAGQIDRFILEAVDLHGIQSLRIGHDGSRKRDDWLLDKVTVEKLTGLDDSNNESLVEFNYNDWLRSGGDDNNNSELNLVKLYPSDRKLSSSTIQRNNSQCRRKRPPTSGSSRRSPDASSSKTSSKDKLSTVKRREVINALNKSPPLNVESVSNDQVNYQVQLGCGPMINGSRDLQGHLSLTLTDRQGRTSALIPVSLKEAGKATGERSDDVDMRLVNIKTDRLTDGVQDIRMYYEPKDRGDKWLLHFVNLNSSNGRQSCHFNVNEWIGKVKYKDDCSLLIHGKESQVDESLATLDITVFTSKSAITCSDVIVASPLPSSPMTANPFIQLFSLDGKSRPICLREFLDDEKSSSVFSSESVVKVSVKWTAFNQQGTTDVPLTLRKARLWHDNAGCNPHWHVDRVEVTITSCRDSLKVDNPQPLSCHYTFPCNNWLSSQQGDCRIVRDLYPSEIRRLREASTSIVNQTDSRVNIRLETGSFKLTDPKATIDCLYLTLFDSESGLQTDQRLLCDSQGHPARIVSNESNTFEWTIDTELASGCIDKIQLYYAGSAATNDNDQSEWFLDKVIIASSTNQQTSFTSNQWICAGSIVDLDVDEGAGDTSRSKSTTTTTTTTKTSCGTETDLSTSCQNNARQLSETFVQTVTVEDLMKRLGLPVGFIFFLPRKSNQPVGDSGPLAKTGIMSSQASDSVKKITYHIRVVTGSMKEAGTPGPVWLICHGPSNQSSGRLLLFNERFGTELKKGSTVGFTFDALPIDELERIEVCNECVKDKFGWYLRQLRVALPSQGTVYRLACERWLSPLHDDGLTYRNFHIQPCNKTQQSKMIPCHLTVSTNDADSAGTDSDVFVKLFGSTGISTEQVLVQNGKHFQRHQVDQFTLEFEDVGVVQKMRLRINGQGSRKAWSVESACLENSQGICVFQLTQPLWLGPKFNQHDRIWTDLVAVVNGKPQLEETELTVTVKTSDQQQTSADSKVCICLLGENGDSGDIELTTKLSTTIKPGQKLFQQGSVDRFKLTGLLDLGELSRCVVWLESRRNTGSWLCDWISVERVTNSPLVTNNQQSSFASLHSLTESNRIDDLHENWFFDCNQWLSTKRTSLQPLVDMACTKYTVIDATLSESSQSENARLVKANWQSSILARINKSVDYDIELSSGPDTSIKITCSLELTLTGDDGSSSQLITLAVDQNNESEQSLKVIESRITCLPLGLLRTISLKLTRSELGSIDAADDDDIKQSLTSSPSSPPKFDCHEIRVKDQIGKQWFTCRPQCTLLVESCSSSTSNVTATTANISSLLLNATSTDLSDAVPVSSLSTPTTSTSDASIDDVISDNDDCQLTFDLTPGPVLAPMERVDRLLRCPLAKYKLAIHTGSKLTSGTMANIFVTMRSQQTELGGVRLVLGHDTLGLFKRKNVDFFYVKCRDLGFVESILVELDSSSFVSDWFLSQIIITNETRRSSQKFVCDQWISAKRGDEKPWKIIEAFE